MEKNENIILGAGIGGLGAYYRARELGLDATIFEAKNEAGGLLANFSVGEFRFDNAVHFSFTENELVRSIFDKITINKHKPNSYCLENGIWMKHPVQNNLFPLATEEKVELLTSFSERPDTIPRNYSEWLNHQYGDEISKRFPERYTKKYWGLNASSLSINWVGNRMRRADFKEILRGALEKRDDNHYYANEMRYPVKGGYYGFISDLVESSNIKFNKKVTKIDSKNKIVYFSDESNVAYEQLISSLPLPVICNLLDDCPPKVLSAANSLLWTTVDLISVGFDKDNIPPYLWYYIYDEENLAARAYSPSIKSTDNAPLGCSSIQFEVYNLSTKKRLDENKLKDNIKESLISDGICNEEDILFVHHKHLPFGNVVFDISMENRRNIVLDYLKSIGLLTCGRFGEWEYFWSDQSFISGYEVFDK